MLLFLVINPENCSDFSIHQNIEEATALLESQGFTLAFKREIKSSPRMRHSYYKNGETRCIYCRNMGEVWDHDKLFRTGEERRSIFSRHSRSEHG